MKHFPVELQGADKETLMWAEERKIDPAALLQLRNLSKLPWVHGIRVMPDVHVGWGATIGSVIAMKGAVSPTAVGVDIGCGMVAVRTNLTTSDLPSDLSRLRNLIESAIPVGWKSHEEPVDISSIQPLYQGANAVLKADFWEGFAGLHADVDDLYVKAHLQMGTLGSGNHFIELCADQQERIWLQLHSGSRHIGKALADQHVDIAKSLPHNEGIVDHELSVFVAGTAEMDAYVSDVTWAQEYAARSRHYMITMVADVVRTYFSKLGKQVDFTPTANVHHNYLAFEEIDGQQMVVTRKGAIRAGLGEIGVIPGSMGTGSYIVRGLGNTVSYQSASHGAGRVLSRRAAREKYTVQDLQVETVGIECRKDSGVLDEIPSAYRDLDQVIRAQSELVEPVERLRTLLCVKG